MCVAGDALVATEMLRFRPLMKRLVEGGASRLGYQVIPEWRLKSLDHARHLRHLLRQLDVDTVFDVGANVGGYRSFLRREVGFSGRIASFEPVPAVYAALARSADNDPAWRGFPIALGDRDGDLDINVTHRSTMSSFLTRDEPRLKALGYQHLLNVTDIVGTERVPVRRLDSVFAEAVDGRRDARVFVKCDTQGFDLQVMAGASGSLGSIVALQIELSFKPIYRDAPAYGEVLAQMTALGFDVTGIYPVRRDELSRILNFDCVMINTRHPAVADLAARIVAGRTPDVA
jgi:FkbM family methyltransferase